MSVPSDVRLQSLKTRTQDHHHGNKTIGDGLVGLRWRRRNPCLVSRSGHRQLSIGGFVLQGGFLHSPLQHQGISPLRTTSLTLLSVPLDPFTRLLLLLFGSQVLLLFPTSNLHTTGDERRTDGFPRRF